ncbi:TatD family hydrolase [Patescibacteria group bacterium]|nr:TatD family hydrolase [Patescibacteria group bacterium]MBU4458674.1 TatD family hydrolase [Patescibacteria group bacterium]MCG2696269.1 TatD family hydrolase [Candidatus Portnoybacteria bacterium]
MLIDTHAHLNFKDFEDDREEIIGRCLANDIWIINVGADLETSQKAIEIAEKHKKGVYAAIAIHPHNACPPDCFDIVKTFGGLARHPRVVAIGECGLDYAFCENDEKIQKLQQKVFIQHLELAKELDKPVIIHSRRLFPEILEIIKKHPGVKGVLHCYMGRWSFAEEYLKLGFYISFTGLITYARDYDKVIKNTSLEKILIETDSPYLIPEPLRKKDELVRNTPENVEYVAQKIAEIKGINFEQVAEQTTKNAKELFNLI